MAGGGGGGGFCAPPYAHVCGDRSLATAAARLRALFRALDPSGALFRPVLAGADTPTRASGDARARDGRGLARVQALAEDGPLVRHLLLDGGTVDDLPAWLDISSSSVLGGSGERTAYSADSSFDSASSVRDSGPRHHEPAGVADELLGLLVAAAALDADVAAVVARRMPRLRRLIGALDGDVSGVDAAHARVASMLAHFERVNVVPQLVAADDASAAVTRGLSAAAVAGLGAQASSSGAESRMSLGALVCIVVEVARELFHRDGCHRSDDSARATGGAGAARGGRVTPGDARLTLSVLVDPVVPLPPRRATARLSPRRASRLSRARARLRELRQRQQQSAAGVTPVADGVGAARSARAAPDVAGRSIARTDAHAVSPAASDARPGASDAGVARALSPLVFTVIMDPSVVAATRAHGTALTEIFREHATHSGRVRVPRMQLILFHRCPCADGS